MKISLLNIHWGAVGLPGHSAFMPGEVVSLEVSEDEHELWKKCRFVEISYPSDQSGGREIPDPLQIPGDKGCLQQNNEVGSPPKPRRAGRPGKVKS